MSSNATRFLTALVTGGVLVASTGLSYADTVTVGPDVTKAPGTTGTFTVGLLVDDNATDPVNGCNANAGNKVTVSFSASDASMIAAPASVLVAGCDDPDTAAFENGVSVSYSVAADAADGASATITAHASGGRTTRSNVSGVFTGDSFVVTVDVPAPSNTAPRVSVTGVADGAVYEIGGVPEAGCSVVDAEDGAAAGATAVITGELTHGLGTQTATCQYTDSGSPALSDSDSVSYTIQDTGDPTITPSVSPAAPESGWYKTAPTASFSCADVGGSGIASCTGDTLFLEGRAETVRGTAVDKAGNTATADAGPVDVDLSAPNAPTVSAGTPDHVGADGRQWYADSATVTFTGTTDPDLADGTRGSGIVSTTAPVSKSSDGQLEASGTSTDLAGNVSTATSGTVWVDGSDPVVTVTGPETVVLNTTGKTAAWTSTDGTGSGVDGATSGTVELNTSTVGTKSVTIPGSTDNVGNQTAASTFTYEVVYAYSALLQPINVDGKSTFKAGSTVPVKFQVVDANGVVQNDPDVVANLKVTKLDSTPDSAVNETVITASGDTGTSFRWDATGQQYVFNLSSKNWSGTTLGEGTYRLDVVSPAGTLTTGKINIKK